MKSFKEILGEGKTKPFRPKKLYAGRYEMSGIAFWNGKPEKSIFKMILPENKKWWIYEVESQENNQNKMSETVYKYREARDNLELLFRYGLIYRNGDWYLDQNKFRSKEPVQ